MWEPSTAFKRIVTLGLWDKEWIRVSYPELSVDRTIRIERDSNHSPGSRSIPTRHFLNATDDDTYWAAKIVMSFTSR